MDGTAYFGTYGGNYAWVDPKFYAVDVESGEKEWEWEQPAESNIGSSPAVEDDVVYFGTHASNVFALDADSGEQIWSYGGGGRFISSPEVDGDTLYIGSDRIGLHAIDTSSGDELWVIDDFSPRPRARSSPVVVGDLVYFAVENDVHAAGTSSEEIEWSYETDGTIDSSPTVVAGTVYIGSDDGHLYALDAETGEESWSFEVGDEFGYASPTVVDGRVYFGNADGNVYAVDRFSGEEIWRYETEDEVESSPTVAGDVVYIGSKDENLYALDAESGEHLWSFDADGWVRSSPTVVDGVVYFGGTGDHLYAVDAGVEGSSRDSRVLHRTLGHHEGTVDDFEAVEEEGLPGFGLLAAGAALAGAGVLKVMHSGETVDQD